MHLKQWRLSEGLSRQRLADKLNPLLNRKVPLRDSHIQAWEGGCMPGADVGEALRKLSKGAIKWNSRT